MLTSGQWNKKARNLSYGWFGHIISLSLEAVISYERETIDGWIPVKKYIKWNKKIKNPSKESEIWYERRSEIRQADTKDLTSSSKVLRVLGPNLTDASSIQDSSIKCSEKWRQAVSVSLNRLNLGNQSKNQKSSKKRETQRGW